jgi:hypothetical protein
MANSGESARKGRRELLRVLAATCLCGLCGCGRKSSQKIEVNDQYGTPGPTASPRPSPTRQRERYVPRKETCYLCRGSGKLFRMCRICDGAGWYDNEAGEGRDRCYNCGGTGKVEFSCYACTGSGYRWVY